MSATTQGSEFFLNSAVEWCIAITTLCAFAAGFYKYIFVPVGRAWAKLNKAFHTFNNAAAEFRAMQHDLAAIKREVMPENGKTLREETRETSQNVIQLQAMFRAQTELNNDAIFITDAKGEPIVVTAGYTKLTGLDSTGVLHGGWERAIFPDDLESVKETWDNAVNNGRIFVDDFHYVHVITGEKKKVHCEARPVRLGTGLVVGYAGKITVMDPVTSSV